MRATIDESPIGDAIAELRVEFRSRIDELPPAELVVPSDVVRRRSQFFAIEAADLLPRDVAFQLIREAIDQAFERGREEGAIAEQPAGT